MNLRQGNGVRFTPPVTSLSETGLGASIEMVMLTQWNNPHDLQGMACKVFGCLIVRKEHFLCV